MTQSVKAPKLMRSQRFPNPPLTASFRVSFLSVVFYSHTHAPHIYLLPTQMCLYAADGCRLYTVGHVGGQRWLQDERESWESLLFIKSLF